MTHDDFLLLGDLLLLVGVGLMVARIFMFGRSLTPLPPQERQRYQTEGRLPGWRTWLPFGALMVLILATNTTLRLGAAAWYVAQTAVDGFVGERRLREHAFDPTLCRTQLRTSLLGALAGLLFASGLLLPDLLGS